VFVASNPTTDNIRDILDGIVRITGLKEWKAREPADGRCEMSCCLALD
jgi:hypothetical protein